MIQNNAMVGPFLFLSLELGLTSHAFADNNMTIDPSSHAPIGVMGDHLHKTGEWMISYRFMQMSMSDNLLGSDDIGPMDIAAQMNPNSPPPVYRVAPLTMEADMHMLGAMYAPNDKFTLMIMANYLEKTMDHQTFRGMMGSEPLGKFTTQTRGVGDTQVSVLWSLATSPHHFVHANLGISLPTGSIDNEGRVLTPMNTRPVLRLPYAMQLGSGTYDLKPGITYHAYRGIYGWGSQLMSTLRLNDNKAGYTLGDQWQWTTWGSYRWADWSSTSLRVSYIDEQSIDGQDDTIQAPVPTAVGSNYGGEHWDLGIGINLVGQEGTIKGQRLSLEYQTTLKQKTHGIQMAMDSMLTLGYQYGF